MSVTETREVRTLKKENSIMKSSSNKAPFPVKGGDFKRSSSCLPSPYLCVEVAVKQEGVAVRDGKNTRRKPLFFTNDEWKAFIHGAKQGEFDPKA